MARSEFRYNIRRKHFAYLFKDRGSLRKNILFSTKPVRHYNNKIYENVRLSKHPNKNSNKRAYVMPKIYTDSRKVFGRKLNWCFDRNDKRKIKRIIKHKKV